MASQQLQNIGLALQGLSAGLGGQLPQFNSVMQQGQQNEQMMGLRQQQMDMEAQAQQQQMAIERQKTMFTDAFAAKRLADRGNYDGVIQLGMNRLQLLQQFPDANPEDTQRIVHLAIASRNGDKEAEALLKGELDSIVETGQAIGVLESPKEREGFSLSPGQVRFDAAGNQIAGVPKAEEGFEIIPKEEAISLGLDPAKPFQRNKQTGQISQIGGGGVEVNVGQATEGERTAGILANRLDFAQSQINDILGESPDAQAPGVLPTMFGNMGMDYLARLSNPAERQIIEAAQDDMLDAALTLGTGAAYTAEQLKGYRRSYFPQLGDEKSTIESKAKRLQNLLSAAYDKAGRAAPETMRSASGAEAPASDAGLSEEERAELQELRARYGR